MDEIIQACTTKSGSVNWHAAKLSWWQNKGLEHLYRTLMDYTAFLPTDSAFSQRVWHWINKVQSIPMCALCLKKEVNWYQTKYLTYCGASCSATATLHSRETTSMKNWGVSNPAKSNVVKDTIKQTNVDKYGVDNYSKTLEFSEFMIDKWANNEWRDAALKNHAFPLNDRAVQEKAKATLKKNWGVDSPFESTEIRARSKNTIEQRYNRPWPNMTHLSLDFLKNLNDVSWVKNELSQKSLREIAVENNISYSALCKKITLLGIDLTNYSSLEVEIANYLQQFTTVELRKKLLGRQEIDIYLPDFNIGIECNGIYWHSEKAGKKDRLYHLNKTVAAEKLGIDLIHIFESEWRYDTEKVKSFLRRRVGKSNTIYGRKTVIAEVSNSDAKKFLNQYHLQGHASAAVCYGLYYKNELVSLMSFGKSRFNRAYEWELIRLVSKENTVVIGGAQKLFSHFVKIHAPTSIISYADRRLFTGAIYRKLGFTFSHYSSPNYFYIEKNGELSSRQKYQKHKLSAKLPKFDSNLTEWENMQANKFDRIWDCGNSAWTWYNLTIG